MNNDVPVGANDAFREQLARILAGSPEDVDAGRPSAPSVVPQVTDVEQQRDSSPPTPPIPPAQTCGEEFVPLAPDSLEEAGLQEGLVEKLVLKFLAARTSATGRETSEQTRLPFRLLRELLRRMKEEQLVAYKADAMADYVYELTAKGMDLARRFASERTYFGAAPVPLDQYAAGVEAQSVRKAQPSVDDLREAFHDLILSEEILAQLGQAITSGLGLFLYGLPGNGKTSIVARMSRVFGDSIWIPRCISHLGEIIRLYDPSEHKALPRTDLERVYRDREVDERWICIGRPTIVVGGELTMNSLEITASNATGVSEAPLQMKSNGGTLVIDDFGRQRITPSELLNRWIVPLENRCDFLNLSNGRKIRVPFDQLIVFSTNLEPRQLVDEAFLRRIPYKIDVKSPSETEFRALLRKLAPAMGIEYREGPVDYLIETHYRAAGRSMRFCHPRDLLHQTGVFCKFYGRPAILTNEAVDAAVKNYFAMM